MQEKAKLVNKSDIKKAFGLRGPLGWLVATIAMQAMGINKAMKLYPKCQGHTGFDFAAKVLEELDIKYDLKIEQLEYIPQEGPFLLLANHHFGGVDGMMVLDIVGHIRPDLHTISNYILATVPEMRDVMFSVNPFTNGLGGGRSSLVGMRHAFQHIRNGGCLGIFPAGAVATYQPPKLRTAGDPGIIEDCPWPESIVKFIRMAECPVVPVYFEGVASKHFHRVGKIDPRLRTANLVNEILNKKGMTIPMRIGKPITVAEMNNYESLDDLYGYLRNRIYAMQAEFEPKRRLIPRRKVEKRIEQIALPRDRKSLQRELEHIKDKMLFQVSSYQCYLADYEDIPNCIIEIGREREEAFRATGEGTNKSLDLDEFDKYYKHLILWDYKDRRIVGAYRIGLGSEIYAKYGIPGFYTSTLFQYNKKARTMLPKCAELGRSFVAVKYQKEALPLMLLFKGLMYAMMKFPEVENFIGPVSISNVYPKAIQSLMVWFFNEHRHVSEENAVADPRTPFVPAFKNVRPEQLLSKTDTVEKFDRLLKQISDNEYRLPTLVKKYFKCGAEIICFNVDPAFNYCLDGFIRLPLNAFPETELLSMLKDEPSWEAREAVLNRFGHSQKKD